MKEISYIIGYDNLADDFDGDIVKYAKLIEDIKEKNGVRYVQIIIGRDSKTITVIPFEFGFGDSITYTK